MSKKDNKIKILEKLTIKLEACKISNDDAKNVLEAEKFIEENLLDVEKH